MRGDDAIDEVGEDVVELVDAEKLLDEARRRYLGGGLKRGDSTGWESIDEHYTVAPGQWTVVTGIPGSGKSEWLDAMLVNLAETDEWEFCLYSPENFPTSTHLIKLAEKRARKPYSRDWPNNPRMTLDEADEAMRWVVERFFWIEPKLRTPESLIERALAYRAKEKKFGVVLDPWNTLDHNRRGMNETDYVSSVLSRVTRLVREANAHVWLVAHPQKIGRDAKTGERPVPTPYDIAGSAHWYNKADNAITVHRDQTATSETGVDEVEVHIQKVRYRHIGRAGAAIGLCYERATGRFFEPAPIDLTPKAGDRTKGKKK